MNIYAVFGGIICGLVTAFISHLLLGQDAMVIGGAIVAASMTASSLTKQ